MNQKADGVRHAADALARDLADLAEHDTRALLDGTNPSFLSAFVTRHREAIGELALPATGLVIVIEGTKELLHAGDRRVYRPGDAILLPAGARFDVVNEPDPATGVYRALFLRLSRELIIEAARLWPEFSKPIARPPTEIGLDAPLSAAIRHAAEAIATPGGSRRVQAHRALEIVLMLAERGALALVPKYAETSIAEAVRLMIRHRLDHAWSAAAVAAKLSMSEATLRRRLRGEGESLGRLLLAERMQAAHVLLCDRDADVAEAVAATGYSSRSHFARHFKAAFGVSPLAARQSGRREVRAVH